VDGGAPHAADTSRAFDVEDHGVRVFVVVEMPACVSVAALLVVARILMHGSQLGEQGKFIQHDGFSDRAAGAGFRVSLGIPDPFMGMSGKLEPGGKKKEENDTVSVHGDCS